MDPRIYTPLSSDPDTLDIRLLRLQPSTDRDASIRCSLFTYTLVDLGERPHLYEALSYVWGDPCEVVAIEISGFEVKVTKNLHTALRRLRDHYFERVLWVDALCIDQGNTPEVARQILSMTQIYSQASRVLVWLGNAADDSNTALEEILGVWSNEHIGAVKRLLERPWFRRIWVLQEVAAARQIRMLCGEKELDSYAIYDGLQRLSRNRGIEHPSVYLLRQATFRYSSASAQNNLPLTPTSNFCLGELLDLYHEYGATKRHDKVYALLGMSTDVKTIALSPDYSTPWEDLLEQVIQYLLTKSVHVKTWHNRNIAIISGQCSIVGRVTSAYATSFKGERTEVSMFEVENGKKAYWSLPPSAKRPRVGDLLCLFKDARKATLLRPCREHFLVIMINVDLHARHGGYNSRGPDKVYDLTSLWDWETSRHEVSDITQDDTTPSALSLLETTDLRMKCARMIAVASVLCGLRQYPETIERLRVITEEQELVPRLDDAQVEELRQTLLVCYVRLEQQHNAKKLFSQALNSRRYVKEGGIWAILKQMNLNMEIEKSWSIIGKVVGHLELRQYELTEKKLVEIALEPVHEITASLLRSKSVLFGYPEIAFLALFTHKFNKLQLAAVLEHLLFREHESEAQNLERILYLTVGVQTGPCAVLRILLLEISRSFGEVEEIMEMVSSLWDRGSEQTLLRSLSQQEQDGLCITDEMRSAAAGSPAQALKILTELLDTPEIHVTNDMMQLAATYGKARLVKVLLLQAGKDVKITDRLLEAASQNRSAGSEIIRLFLDDDLVGLSSAESYLRRANGAKTTGDWEQVPESGYGMVERRGYSMTPN